MVKQKDCHKYHDLWDCLGGELARVVRQLTNFLLQALVAQIWINFAILKQPLEKDHAPYVGGHNVIEQ